MLEHAEMHISQEKRYDRKRCVTWTFEISLTVVYRFPDGEQKGTPPAIDFSRRREGKRVHFCE